ncbi:Eco57I restriction-modification methylase domain-containing protein [Pseudanabaena cinerea]|uniref:Eco57I restriction-modification methylase domain-containing protein n=1 Tax=Pseudanabaena cinerea TaxID=2661616 RepID=UPI0018EF5092|nr:N-6 DNA methylase [Pseudanabaena cinerea]
MTVILKNNKPLFSQHYLDHRIQECSEWQFDVTAKFDALLSLYLAKKDLLPKLSEAQTEEVFIKPALDILGFSNIPQVTTHGKGRAERPDYALFNNEGDRDHAYPLQDQETAFYTRVNAIAEAKYWERPLSKVSANDQKDIYKNANPSFQITNYLVGTGVDWGILTNGREWRLYYRLASSTATEFYQIDLVELLESQTENKLEQFKYFWLFFCADSFVKNPQGRNFLERVRDGSNTYAKRVGEELKALVFEQVFPSIAGGFAANAFRLNYQVTPEEIYEATLSFLYKLLFLLYAEARNLLPINNRDYRELSIIQTAQEIASRIDQQRTFGQTTALLYERLLNLFRVVDLGDANLEVPRYNGGLFHFEFNQSDDQVDYPANHFLYRFKLADVVLAPALDKLARFEGLPIDYSFLGVRQLGSIYEGLLEYRVVIDNAEKGEVHLENDKGDRKSTGSYYTPDYIVKYIVSNTLKPILTKRSQRFSELMVEISQLHQQLLDKRLGVQSRNGIQKDLQRLEREAQKTLLDIKVCDPSMGSGHFLVEAVDYLTDEIILILNQYPDHNPILEMLNQTRQNILENLAKQGIKISPDRLEPTQLLQRVVMKRCIYGVDLNSMAVELAKVSLWLHSFTVGAPLSFLDHHLRCGNSLIGTTVKEAEAGMAKDATGQLNLMAGPFVGLLRAAEIMRGVSILSDATFAELEQSEKLFRQFDQAAKPYKRLLDIYVSKFFGLKRAEHFLSVFGTKAISADPAKMNKADAAVYKNAQKLSDEKHFFHWDLEFPEVFIDLENACWHENAGFDAVIGNPPWGSEFSAQEKIFLQTHYQLDNSSNIDSYAIFTKTAIQRTKLNGNCGYIIPDTILRKDDLQYFRKFLLANTELDQSIETGPLFREVRDTWCLILLMTHKNPSVFHRIDHKQIDRSIVSVEERLELFGNQNWLRQSKTAQIYWQTRPNLVIGYLSSRNEQKIISLIEQKSISLAIHSLGFTISRGEEGSKFNLKSDKDSNFQMVIPENVERYYVNQGINISDKTLTPNKVKNYYNNPKIWIIRIQKLRWMQRIVSAFDQRTNSAGMKTLQIVISKSNNTNNLLFLSTLLSSKLINFWCSDYLVDDMNQSYLEKLPIREFEFTTPTDRRQQALENAIALYNQYQSDRQITPLLTQVNHHLSQQPEEADVIHDLLAYLAEQMIELNKQKQTEIKSFLQWLERFIGCQVDTLTNKSKIQNYLGDYYKNESNLSFDELIEILKKNRKKIKIDPVARKEQREHPKFALSRNT